MVAVQAEIGAFHKVSEKHLDRYLEELEWRYGNRENHREIPS